METPKYVKYILGSKIKPLCLFYKNVTIFMWKYVQASKVNSDNLGG